MDINYTSDRKLNREFINRLPTCKYISEHRNLFITGGGKTYMACAFGMEACMQYYSTKYVRIPDLLMDLEIAYAEETYHKVIAKADSLDDAIIDRIAHNSYRINITSIDTAHDKPLCDIYNTTRIIYKQCDSVRLD